MKLVSFAIALAFTISASAFADNVSERQKKMAKYLPQTVVIKVSKTNPDDVRVAHSGKKLSKKQLAKLKEGKNLKFSKVAVNSEVKGLPFNTDDELDVDSSKEAWFFGWGWNNSWRWNSSWGWNRWAFPSYRWSNFNYSYQPYFWYPSGNWNYYYCNWAGW